MNNNFQYFPDHQISDFSYQIIRYQKKISDLKSGNLKSEIRHLTIRKSGFTLIELLVVISIIGILTSLLFVSFTNIQQQARNAQRKNDLKQYQTALENYSLANNSAYPSKTDGAGASASTGLCPSLSGFMAGCPEDPRKNDDSSYSYLYQSDGTGAGATALKWALWAKLEGGTNFWVVCSDARTGEKASGFSVSGGACPL